jgi:hypothetical protein
MAWSHAWHRQQNPRRRVRQANRELGGVAERERDQLGNGARQGIQAVQRRDRPPAVALFPHAPARALSLGMRREL